MAAIEIEAGIGGTDAPQAAREAGLRYVTDAVPGIRRRRAGRSFSYRAPDGTTIRDAETLERIRALAIPPAWTEVWISPQPDGHLQAVGRDAKGRKQYRYHPRWRAFRDEDKYGRLAAFGGALPEIRRRVDEDLSRRGLPIEKVLATVVRLLDATLIRVGNDEYARLNESYGLTTMLDEHADIEGSRARFHFRGKSGKVHEVAIQDRRLARVIKRCQDLPGDQLFQYIDDAGVVRDVDSSHVNDYLREVAGQDFTAKDFRTWGGTVLAARLLREEGVPTSETDAKRRVVAVVKEVSRHLGNTPAVARRSYIHPAVVDAYLDQSLLDLPSRSADGDPRRVPPPDDLDEDEEMLLSFLRAQG